MDRQMKEGEQLRSETSELESDGTWKELINALREGEREEGGRHEAEYAQSRECLRESKQSKAVGNLEGSKHLPTGH